MGGELDGFAINQGLLENVASLIGTAFLESLKSSVADYTVILEKRTRTVLLLGCSGNGKSATGNSILRKKAFLSKGRAAAVTKECELKTAKGPSGQIINVIDTPGLFSLFPSNEANIREILKCVHLAKDGINAVLMVFSLRSRLTEEEKSVLFVLKMLFGNDIVNYMIIVFTNEDSLDDNNETMKDYLEECQDFKEILAECNNRMVLFDNRPKASESKKAKQVQELLDLVEVVSKNNKKPFMVDLSHETMENEAVIEDKKKKIKAMKGHYTKEEMSNCKEEAENSLQHQLSQRINKVLTKLIETESLLEHKLTEEKNARLEAEKRAYINILESLLEHKLTEEKNARPEAEERPKDLQEELRIEIQKLREKLVEVEKKLKEKGGSCIIL